MFHVKHIARAGALLQQDLEADVGRLEAQALVEAVGVGRVESSSSLTYAEYARRGFFELSGEACVCRIASPLQINSACKVGTS